MADQRSLSQVVIDALQLHSSYQLPELNLGHPAKRIVIASGNALPTGRIIFRDEPVLFADEGQYTSVLDNHSEVRDAVVISASGGKHAPIILRDLLSRNIVSYLLTCQGESEAANVLKERNLEHRIRVTKSNPEPITYNTSTYLGMILAKTREDPVAMKQDLSFVDRTLPSNLEAPPAFYLMVPPEFDLVREMFVTKFDELFGPMKVGRCYTTEQTRHAKTVVYSPDEMFISFGFDNRIFGNPALRWNIPLRKNIGFAAIIAMGYYAIGKIQEANLPYFHQNAAGYAAFQKRLFDRDFFEKGLTRLEPKD